MILKKEHTVINTKKLIEIHW